MRVLTNDVHGFKVRATISNALRLSLPRNLFRTFATVERAACAAGQNRCPAHVAVRLCPEDACAAADKEESHRIH